MFDIHKVKDGDSVRITLLVTGHLKGEEGENDRIELSAINGDFLRITQRELNIGLAQIVEDDAFKQYMSKEVAETLKQQLFHKIPIIRYKAEEITNHIIDLLTEPESK